MATPTEPAPPAARPLQGRAALVTGAGSGLGRATSLRLADRGAFVVATDCRLDDARDTATLVSERGGGATALELDVADSKQVSAVLDEVVERFGASFDCLVNNAGLDRGASVADLSDEEWATVVAVNQSGPLYTMREFVRRILAQRPREVPADIVNVISISAITVGTDAAAYNSSKAALAMLTRIAQREAHEYKWPIRIHGLMPSAMNTPMMAQWNLPDEVMMHPDTVAAAIEFMVTLPPDTFVHNLVINSRREPGWPR